MRNWKKILSIGLSALLVALALFMLLPRGIEVEASGRYINVAISQAYYNPDTIDIANTPGSYGFGIVENNTTYSTGLTYFTLTNNSDVEVNLTISGFVPDVERTSVITYVPDSEYKAQVKVDTKVSPGYEPAPPEIVNWVTFDNDTILIAPDTYAPIWVNLEVPEGTELPNKWEFIIVITLSSGRQSTGVAMAINYEIGIKVIMG